MTGTLYSPRPEPFLPNAAALLLSNRARANRFGDFRGPRARRVHIGLVLDDPVQRRQILFQPDQPWTALQSCGPVLSLTQLGGHTLLAIDKTDNQFMTADALPENWQPVVGPAHEVLAIGHLKSGKLDHIPTDLPDRIAPKLVEHYERVKAIPQIRAYYAKHGISG